MPVNEQRKDRGDAHLKERLIAFYDGSTGKLLADYVHGNPRAEQAIELATGWLPPTARRVLDLGCGIGWSTVRIKRARPAASVLGLDISPASIRVAKVLFGAEGIRFEPQDITQWNERLFLPPFDAVVMLDVWEHIPAPSRPAFYRNVRRCLSPEGTVVATFPSVSYQDWLRGAYPSHLQPVDEDITEEEVARFCAEVDVALAWREQKSVRRPHDYVHLVFSRRPDALPGPEAPEPSGARARHTKEEKDHLVHDRLRVHVTREGLLLRRQGAPGLVIFCPTRHDRPETFIRAHAERLPADVELLFGPRFDRTAEGRRFLSFSYPHRAGRALLRTVRAGIDHQWFEARALRRYLLKCRFEAGLAEYGMAGAKISSVCTEVGLPLIVHFHGYDAYNLELLDEFGDDYARMFEQCAAVVAVSRDMQQQLIALGAPREKVHHNPYGVDCSLFTPADPSANPPLFVGVGRFVDKKAPHLTIFAFRAVLDACPEARLKMIGDGPLRAACRDLADVLGIGQAVELPGALPHAGVAAAMSEARAFVQHSVRAESGDCEGTPVAVLEAGASGLPAVATRHAGIKDAVVEGETGLLVDERDVGGMAEQMISLARDPQLARRLGGAARRRVSSEFSMEKSMAGLWKIIQDAVSGR